MPKSNDQKPSTSPDAQTSPGARTPVKWDTMNLKSSYANFCNASSTRSGLIKDDRGGCLPKSGNG